MARGETQRLALANLADPLHYQRIVELGLDVVDMQQRKLFSPIAQALAGGLVEGDEAGGFGVDQDDGVGGLAEHRIDQALLLGQRTGAALDQGDVAGHAQQAGHGAIVAVHRGGDDLEERPAAVLRQGEPLLAGADLPIGSHLGIVDGQRLAIGRLQRRMQRSAFVLRQRRRLHRSGHALEGGVAQGQLARGGLKPDQVGHGAQGVGQQALALLQVLGRLCAIGANGAHGAKIGSGERMRCRRG